MNARRPSNDSAAGKILAYLETGATVSRMEANYLFQVANVPDIMHRLRQMGWPIETIRKKDIHGHLYSKWRLGEQKGI